MYRKSAGSRGEFGVMVRMQISKKLACGDVGDGALAEPQAIAQAVRAAVSPMEC